MEAQLRQIQQRGSTTPDSPAIFFANKSEKVQDDRREHLLKVLNRQIALNTETREQIGAIRFEIISEKEKTAQIKEDLAAKQADIQQVQMIMKNA